MFHHKFADDVLRSFPPYNFKTVVSEQNGIGNHIVIGAFNLRIFGQITASNPEVMATLVKVRY